MKSFSTMPRFGGVLRLIAAVLLAIALLPTQLAEAAPKAPQKVTTVSVSKDAIGLSWSAVSGATRYTVSYATTSSMKGAKSTTSKSPAVELKKLKSKTTYYVTVVADTKKGKSSASKKLAVKTASTSASNTYLAPTGLKAAAPKDGKSKISWTSRGSGVYYQVSVATKSSFSGAKNYYVKGTSVTASSLKAGSTYYVRARVVTSKKSARSGYSSSIKVSVPKAKPAKPAPTKPTTPAPAPSQPQPQPQPIPDPAPPKVEGPVVPPGDKEDPPAGNGGPARLTVASFNIGSKSREADTQPWEGRRDVVVKQIRSQAPDVIGLQEASQGKLEDTLISQAEDLVSRLGGGYKMVNEARYNCQNPKTPYNCEPLYRGASNSQKIVYNSNTVDVVAKGSKNTGSLKTRFEEERYVEWALFRDKASGKQFYFFNVHLDPGKAKESFAMRKTQMGVILALIAEKNPGNKVPTYVVGDFNSHKWIEGGNVPYDLMRKAGFVDPLGNTYMSTSTTEGATVKKRINTEYSSFNDWSRTPPVKPFVNGIYLDYIFTTKGVQVPEWETVVDVDKSGKFVGPIPSDHNMIRATTIIP